MPYELPPSNKPTYILLPWKYIFAAMSLSIFPRWYRYLDFPVEPNEKLRQLAHDVLLCNERIVPKYENKERVKRIYADPVEGIIKYDVLDGVPDDADRMDKVNALFANTFAYLDDWGYGEVIYAWGLQSREYQDRSDFITYNLWGRMLENWVMLTIQDDPIAEEDIPADYDRDKLTPHPSYLERVRRKKLKRLEVSPQLYRQIRISHLKNRATTAKSHEIISTLRQAKKNIWDEYAYASFVGSHFLELEPYHRADLRMWREILAVASDTDVRQMENWLESNMKHYIDWYPDIKPPIYVPDIS